MRKEKKHEKNYNLYGDWKKRTSCTNVFKKNWMCSMYSVVNCYLPSKVNQHKGMSGGLRVRCPSASQLPTITFFISLCEV